jgi:hypothetical protein
MTIRGFTFILRFREIAKSPTSKSFVPNGAKVVPKRAKTICANSCQNSSGPYVILLISGVSIPDRAEPRENTELDLNKPYVSLNGTNFWCQKETCQQRVPKRDVPTRAKKNTCQRVPKIIRANACHNGNAACPKKKKKYLIKYSTVL